MNRFRSLSILITIGLLALAAISGYAEGPRYLHKDSLQNLEFQNIYNDIRNLLNNPHISTATITDLTVTNLTGGTGRIMQSSEAVVTTVFNTTSNAFQDTGLTATITPTTATSDILVMITSVLYIAAATVQAYATIYRDGTTNLGGSNGFATVYDAGHATEAPVTMIYLDSPATTNATEYDVRLKNSDNVTTAGFGEVNIASRITLLEIKQ